MQKERIEVERECVVEVAGEAGPGPRSDGRETRARRRRSQYYWIIAFPVQ